MKSYYKNNSKNKNKNYTPTLISAVLAAFIAQQALHNRVKSHQKHRHPQG